MRKTVLFGLVSSAAAVCFDDANFISESGLSCSSYATGADCRDQTIGLSAQGLTDVLANCQAACNSCVKAADVCEIGFGGDTFALSPPNTDNFDFIDQELLSDLCRWSDKPEGLHMNSNAWGNQPGRNFVFGCMALIKDIEYTDFIIQVDAYHDDNDAFGWIFGYQNDQSYYQAWQQNDYWWPPNPADGVPGPVLKFSKRDGECYGDMNASTLCYDTFAYNANFDERHESQQMEDYPNGRNSSVPYFPSPYVEGYRFFHHNDVQDYVVRHTLVVYKGEARAYFYSDQQELVGVWSDLPADYVGGRLGLFVSAHQPTITNITIMDLSDAATPQTTQCEQAGATCDTSVGVCVGGPTFSPTLQPTLQPTMAPTNPQPTNDFPTLSPTILLSESSCVDDSAFISDEGLPCSAYAVYSDCRDVTSLVNQSYIDLMESCQKTCDSCVKAAQFCEIGEGGDRVELLPPYVEDFTFIDQELLSDECRWVNKVEGLHMASNAWGNQPGRNFVMGCMALVNHVEYTDFILEIEAYHDDNDAFGQVFGYQDESNYYQAWGQNDYWWPPNPADGVPGPVLKVTARRNKECIGTMNASTICYDTIGYNANFDERHESSELKTYPNGRTSSVPYYPAPYVEGYRSYHHNDVEDHVVRHVFIVYKGEFRSYHYSDGRELVGVWGSLPADYVGGKVGIFVSAHQPTITRLAIVDLSDGATPMTTGCIAAGDTCDTKLGICPYVPTLAPTPNPSNSMPPSMAPTMGAVNKIAAADFCQGPVSATAKTVVDTTTTDSYIFVDQEFLTGPCQWNANATGLSQVTQAWGNAPGDNTLMGCLAIYPGQTYTDFIFEVDVTHQDNDGWGVVFGYDVATKSHYMGTAINEQWPVSAADGIRGPFLKLKKTNGKPCLERMDNTTSCYDTLSHLDSNGFNREAMGVPVGTVLAKEYESKYPFANTDIFEQATKMVLIVKGQEARVYFPSPGMTLDQTVGAYRQGVAATATWTFDLQGYSGGMVGVMTYAHEATFSNWRITDITDPSAITAYCDGVEGSFCDNNRGILSTGLCFSVPANDVCEDAVGAQLIDSSTFSTFDLFGDPGVEGCAWSITGGSKIYQQSNSNSGTTVILGCNAVIKEGSWTDFIMQVDIDNNDNDAVGLQFGWKSIDDHFRLHKMNDRWPNPSYDGVPGPVFKLRRKIPGVPCMAGTVYNESTSCYQVISFIDENGPYHDGLAFGAVTPFEYSKVYMPFSQTDPVTRMVVIVRDNTLRAYYEDAGKTKAVGIFAHDLTKYDYSGGQVGLFISGHQAAFSNIKVAALSGSEMATEFCDKRNYACNPRHGLCLP